MPGSNKVQEGITEYVVRQMAQAVGSGADEGEQMYCFSSADHLNYNKRALLDQLCGREWQDEDLLTDSADIFFTLALGETETHLLPQLKALLYWSFCEAEY